MRLGIIVFIVALVTSVLVYIAEAEIQYLLVDDQTGAVIVGQATNSASSSGLSTNWFTGVNITSTNIVSDLSRYAPGAISGYELGYLTATSVNINAGAALNASDTVFIDSTNSFICDMPGDLDIGTELTSVWYYVYVGYTNTNSTAVACLLSTNAVTPTGLVDYRRIGSIYNDFNGDFRAFEQVGSRNRRTVLYGGTKTDLQALTLGDAGVYTPVNLETFMPETAENAQLGVEFRADNGAAADIGFIRPSTGQLDQEFSAGVKSVEFSKFVTQVFIENRQIEYRVTQNNKNDMNIFVFGYQEVL